MELVSTHHTSTLMNNLIYFISFLSENHSPINNEYRTFYTLTCPNLRFISIAYNLQTFWGEISYVPYGELLNVNGNDVIPLFS